MTSIFNNFLKYRIHTQNFCFYRVSHIDLNRTKYSALHKVKIDLDLTVVFGLKKSSTRKPDLNQIEHIWKYIILLKMESIFKIVS